MQYVTDMVKKGFEIALTYLARVFYTKSTRRSIAGVRQRRQVLLRKTVVVFLEICFAHQHLAADLYLLYAEPGKLCSEGNRPDLADIGGDIVPENSIAPWCSPQQLVVLVHQRNACAIEFGLNTILDLRKACAFFRSAVPIAQVIFIV